MEQQQDKIRWEPLVLTEDKAQYLWDQMQRFPQAFDDFSKGNYEDFLAKFFIPNNVFIDIGPGLGLAAGLAAKPGLDVVIHLVMFDQRLRGREVLFKEIMGYYFRALRLQRMTAIVTSEFRPTIKLLERLGFKYEGCMRRAILRDGQFKDAAIYGILKEEFDENPRVEARGSGAAVGADISVSTGSGA